MLPIRRLLILAASWLVPSAALHAAVVYVDADAPGANNGTTWINAYTSLATAITNVAVGDEVWVAQGVYEPFSLRTGVRIYGGFAGTETSRSASNPTLRKCYLRGASPIVTANNVDATAILRGFWLDSGTASDAGGAMLFYGSSPIIVQCVFNSNSAGNAGGAVANRGFGSPAFVNCRFHDNSGGYGGGAFYNYEGSPSFTNCLFYRDQAAEAGALLNIKGSVTLTNCTFAANTASYATGKGGALFHGDGNIVVRNCIVWTNQAGGAGDDLYHSLSAPITVSYSNLQGPFPGAGNLYANPVFINPAADDYRITSTSPCRDTADAATLPSDVGDLDWDGNLTEAVPRDLSGMPRIYGNAVDMGAYEYRFTGPGGGGPKDPQLPIQ